FDSEGRFGDRTSRSYILADGKFKPDANWTWGFGAERVSDPTLFVRYRIRDYDVQRGPFSTDTLRLISQAYVMRQDQDSFVSVAAMSFQSLRVAQSGRNIYVADNVAAFPTVAPLVEGRYNLPRQILGGRLRLQVSAVSLDRKDAVASPLIPGSGFLIPATQQAPLNSYLDYVNSRRVSASLDWRTSFTFGPGMRAEPFIQARGDLYSLSDPKYVSLDAVGNKTTEHAADNVARAVGVVGADFSWPFVRQVGTASIILEPLVQAAFAPTFKAKVNIPNEDSLAFEFEPTNLFSTDRFPGYDLYEGGVRFNVGARASYNLSGGRHASLLVGRVFRTEPNPAFTVQSGLRGTASDWMTALEVTPINGLSLFSRARLDADSFAVRREEAGFNWSLPHGTFGLRYLYNDQDALNLKTQSIDLAASYFFTKNWGASVTASRDLQQDVWPRTQFSLLYQNDCIQLALVFTHDQTYDNRIAPSNSIQIRLNLTTLGNSTGGSR
ncbi:MAG: LPS-assembly protein LptD, partial [Caulobacteraceae bacterium]